MYEYIVCEGCRKKSLMPQSGRAKLNSLHIPCYEDIHSADEDLHVPAGMEGHQARRRRMNICKYNQTDFCKFKSTCPNIHENEICQVKNCSFKSVCKTAPQGVHILCRVKILQIQVLCLCTE